MNPSELDDCTSESDSGESPSTPRTMASSWPPPATMPLMAQHPTLHRTQSFNDYNPHMSPYGHPGHHQVPQHRYSLSGGHPTYPGAPAMHDGQAPQHHMQLQRAETMPATHHHPYYVTDHNNPGVATMNTNPAAAHHQMQPQYHHAQMAQRPPIERLPLEIPYTAPGLTASLQSSPSTFSSAGSGRSPASQDGPFYAHHQPTQAATYALAHAASPVDVHSPATVMSAAGYTQQPQQQQQQHHGSPQPPQGEQPQHQQPYQAPQPVHVQAGAPQDGQQWYPTPPQYQAPVPVDVNPTIGQIPAFNSAGAFDPWAEKFEDPTIEMPSARIADM